MSDPPDPDSPPPRTTGGNWRWEPPSAEELEKMLPGYTVEKLLGQGGMGAVYKGVQKSLDRPVAIKILPGGIEKEDPHFAERFRNEAKVMARLLHPAIVAVFDFGEARDGQFFFVMEYIDGTDIAEMISSQGQLPAEHALAITAHVCDALAAAHDLGIVHRDIKPANVLINRQGQVKVADFGLAKIDEHDQRSLTQTGVALGTPDYVAPEALIMGVNVDARADLYAVGVMLYQMLTGELPRGAWKAPSEKVPGLDHRFDDIVVKAMQSEPADRYQSAVDLRHDLDVILTVPLVKADKPQSAALPQQIVEQVPGQRTAAPKMMVRGNRAAKPPEQVTAPVTPAPESSGKKAVFLWGGLGAAALIVAAAVYFGTAGKRSDEATPPATVIAETPPKPQPEPAKEPAPQPEPSEETPKPVAEVPATPAVTETPAPKEAIPDPPKVADATPENMPTSPPVTPPPTPDPGPPAGSPAPAELVAPTPATQPTLDVAAIPGLKTRLDGYLNARRDQVGALATNYLRGLDVRLNQAADAGDLALVKAFRDEKARVEALQKTLAEPPDDLLAAIDESATLLDLPEDTPEGVAILRTTWQTERQKIRDILDTKLRQSLKTLEGQLTKAREFEKAEVVLAYRERSGKAPAEPAPIAANAPESVQPATTNPAVGTSSLRLPPWLEKAAEEGGKLRIWGTIDGKPIDEKEVLKEFRESDFTHVMTGDSRPIFALRKSGKGKGCTIDLSGSVGAAREFRKLQAMSRTNGVWLADDRYWQGRPSVL